MELFTYGTLCIPQVIEAVLGRVPAAIPGTLAGYDCALIQDAVYPGIFPQQGSSVSGLIYSGLRDEDWALLDRYEGPEYHRSIQPVTASSGVIPACVYVLNPGSEVRCSQQPWDENLFIQQHLKLFLKGETGG